MTQELQPNRPLVSVVIPVYNQADYLPLAIRSVLEQTYEPIELIVVNDGSTDDTASVISRYAGQIHVIDQENRGAANALNTGVTASQGSLICWLSADDEFLPGKIRAQVDEFESNADLAISFTGYDNVDEHGRRLRRVSDPPLAHSDMFLSVFWKNPINGSSVMMRRATFERFGPFNEQLRADVDGEMWLRVCESHPVLALPSVYVRYRIHANSLSANRKLMTDCVTAVRRPYIVSGALRARIERVCAPQSSSRIMAAMAVHFARQGWRDLAELTIRESMGSGRASPYQISALVAIRLLNGIHRTRPLLGIARAMLGVGRAVRRKLGPSASTP